MAGVWMLCGLGFGIFLIIKNYYWSSNNQFSSVNQSKYSKFSYYLVFFLLLFFTLLAMIATGFVIAENQKSLHTTKKLKETILGAGNEARRTIHKINKVMTNIKALLTPYDQETCILLDATSLQLGNESHNIKKFIQKNEHSIDQATWALYITNLVVVTVNLLFLVASVVLILLHWHPRFFILIFFCWILTMACWFLTGIDFFFHNFAEDTCTALEDFKDNPVNSSLSSLLPCANALKSQTVITVLGQTVHDIIRLMLTQSIVAI
ncbi:uncharacterized protein LOC110682440 isoform X1 [Chenopodium quinoa]|uniref:uncharacterized protein LOC110682440 isoform X1 n=1 Tax=Chenopodium quinoa TaxID=63459 RepID=UPI000B7933C0|nr:uncharacterized protein LOC110682440 isoform X1 [Chenopodium quinoa]XP_021714473.1 uncharacterized protein LOC110682440 isoform X1 [Chenopodium quinoa]